MESTNTNNTGMSENGIGIPEKNTGIPEENAGVPEENAGAPEESAAVPEENAGVPEDKTIRLVNRTWDELISAEIRDIWWERILLHMDVQITRNDYPAERDLQFYMVTGFYKANAVFDAVRGENDLWHITLNVTNPGYRFCLPTAHYSLVVCDGEDILNVAQVSEELAPKLFEKSRFFKHNGKTTAYCINISLKQREDGLYPEFFVFDTKKAGLKIFNKYVKKKKKESFWRKKYKQLRKKYMPKLKKYARKLYHRYRDKYRNKPRKAVLFMSEQNEVMKFNLKAVYNRMLERGLDKEFEILQSFRSYVSRKPRQYGFRSWLDLLKKLGKADYIFVDDHCPLLDWLTLEKDQVLVQLWHAGAGYKAVGYSRWGHTGGCPTISCHRQYRYGITPGMNIAHFFSEQFGINESQILPTCMPRMDSYLDPEYRKTKTAELYEQFPICKGKKVILFAPTFRGNDKKGAHYPYQMIDFERLYNFCGDEYVVLFKMHPWVPTAVPIEEQYLDRFIDVGTYPDINDLFYITDIFISDYSSGIFEYALMGKPALFFAFDELQVSFVRGFHRDYKSSTPGKVCHTFDELITALENKDYEFEKMEAYVKYHYDHLDTHSSDRVIDWILLDQMPEEIRARLQADEDKVQRLRDLDFAELKKKAEDDELADQEKTEDDESVSQSQPDEDAET